MSDEICGKLMTRCTRRVFTLFAKAVTVALEEALTPTQLTAPPEVTVLSHLNRFAACYRIEDLEVVASAAQG
jgi:hypothetical protein